MCSILEVFLNSYPDLKINVETQKSPKRVPSGIL